jgi:hypothetical protein
MVCLLKNVDPDVFGSKSKDWTHSIQNTLPHRGYYVIKLHHSKGNFYTLAAGQREKLWREFFLDPSQWWDHRSEKVSERQTSQSSHVNGAIACVSVNLVALSWLLSCPGRNFEEIIFQSFALVG